ncbi:structural cement protein Gp24 [Lonepinella sp. BR2904]|uniref:structural cement protein Gp24 n=1 Tax=Lonepinella sp. BR2904 TaxID=3434551 RepID=UPI003F6E2AEC
MSYARHTAIATAGDIGKGGLANSKTVAYMNSGDTPLVAGRFVALSATGVAALAAKTDTLAGVVVRTVIKDETAKGELCDVMHIGTADSIWVEIAKGETVARGNKVVVVAVANGEKLAGQIQAKTDNTNGIATDYTVITVAGQLAEITRL